jgi:hypothetical protein
MCLFVAAILPGNGYDLFNSESPEKQVQNENDK